MADETVKSAQSVSQSRITLTSEDGFDLPGTWAQMEGGNTGSEVTRYKEGGELFRDNVKGHPPRSEQITLRRPYRRDRDIEIYRWARRNASAVVITITEQPLDEAEIAYGKPLVERALLVGVERPAVDADGNEIKRLALIVEPFGELA